jgi:hypothetical protein
MLLTKPAPPRSNNYVNPHTRSTDAGASHYLPSQPPPHDRVNDNFPNESTTVDNDNYILLPFKLQQLPVLIMIF